jgi:hypothetical protein
MSVEQGRNEENAKIRYQTGRINSSKIFEELLEIYEENLGERTKNRKIKKILFSVRRQEEMRVKKMKKNSFSLGKNESTKEMKK